MSGHVRDEQLAMLLHGELSGRESARIERHLAYCAECMQRRQLFAAAGEQMTSALQADRGEYEFRGPWLRSRVRQRMRAASKQREASGFFVRFGRGAPLIVGLMMLAAVGATCVMLLRAGTSRRGRMAEMGKRLSEPDHQLTPGAVRAVGMAALCREDGTDYDPEVPTTVRTAVFQRYGMSGEGAEQYQVDYLVSPQLGGTDTMENLWPQPYGATEWNARAKDALEKRLREMVCTGQVDLASAQEAIRLDWIGAYGKYMSGVKAR